MSDSASVASTEIDEQTKQNSEENKPHENLASIARQVFASISQIVPEDPTKETKKPSSEVPVEPTVSEISSEVKESTQGTEDSANLEMSAIRASEENQTITIQNDANEEEEREELAENVQEEQESATKSTRKRKKKRSRRNNESNASEQPSSEIVSNTDKGFLTEPSACMNTDYEASAPAPRHSTKRGETSAENYNPDKPCVFTEPATLEAMVQCGVDQREMFMPTAAEMSKYPNDPDIRKMVTEHHQKRIERLREMVLQKREETINKDEERSFMQQERGVSEEHEEDMDFLKVERKKWEKAQAFQRREAEALVLSALKEEERQKQGEERERREFERMRKIQEEREKANTEAHKRHQQRLKELEEQVLRRSRDRKQRKSYAR